MKFTQRLRSSQGFTLVELIIVIMIIGILSATLLPKVMGAPASARDTARIAKLQQLVSALTIYYGNAGAYPTSAGVCLDSDAAPTGVAQLLINGDYFDRKDFPRDPQATAVLGVAALRCTGEFYYKALTRNGIANQAFVVMARMENTGKANASSAAAPSNDVETVVNTYISGATGTAKNTTDVYNAYAITGG